MASPRKPIRPTGNPRQRYQVNAGELNALARDVHGLQSARAAVTGMSLQVSHVGGQPQLLDLAPPDVWARIIAPSGSGSVATSVYAWQEVYWDSDAQQWRDWTDGRSGTVTSQPACEANDNDAVPDGTVVRLFPAADRDSWEFEYAGSGGSLTVEEADGDPSLTAVTKIQFDGLTVSNPAAGVARVTDKDRFVQISSTTLTSGRYSGRTYTYDPDTSTWSADSVSDDIWIVMANSLQYVPVTSQKMHARLAGTANSRPVYVVDEPYLYRSFEDTATAFYAENSFGLENFELYLNGASTSLDGSGNLDITTINYPSYYLLDNGAAGSYTVRAIRENTACRGQVLTLVNYSLASVTFDHNNSAGTAGYQPLLLPRGEDIVLRQRDGIVLQYMADGTSGQGWYCLGHSACLQAGSNGVWQPPSLADGSAPNNSVYYSTTASKLVYKDSGGTVNNLY